MRNLRARRWASFDIRSILFLRAAGSRRSLSAESVLICCCSSAGLGSTLTCELKRDIKTHNIYNTLYKQKKGMYFALLFAKSTKQKHES